MKVKKSHTIHRFLDEAGDCTFYGKKRKSIIGTMGVSNCFILGMIKFKEAFEPLREKIVRLQLEVANDPYFQVPSVIKRKRGEVIFFMQKMIYLK